jgi:ABC-type branched-subunit amino acid transport system substrate-binding protein
MANVLEKFDVLKDNLMKVVVNDIAALNALDGVVESLRETMETADGFYRQGKGNCHAKLSGESFEYALYTLGPLSYLLQKALSEYYFLAFGYTAEWREESHRIELEQEAYVVEDSETQLLYDAFTEFKNAWDDYRNTEEETSLGLRVEYISQNPYEEAEKLLLDRATSADAYHAIHGKYHPIYRSHMEERKYMDIFILDLEGNLIYSVKKLDDFATNFEHGKWKDEGLGLAWKQALDEPDTVQVIAWKPYGPIYPTYASFLSHTIRENVSDGDVIGVFATRVPVEAQTHDSVGRLLEAEQGAQKILDDFIYGDLKHYDSTTQKVEPIYPPPDQVNADALFGLLDVMMPLIPIFEQNESETNLKDTYHLVTQDKALSETTAAVLQSYVDVAWADAPSVHGTRIAIAFQQLGIIQSMAKKSSLLTQNGELYNVTAADIQAAMDEFEHYHEVLKTGQRGEESHSRRLASAQPAEVVGGQEAVGTTNKDEVVGVAATQNEILTDLMNGVDGSWAILKPFLQTVVATKTEGNIYEVARKSYDLVRQMRKAADWYASTTRTTTLAELKILSTIPLTGDWAAGKTMQVAALVTESVINEQQRIIEGYNLRSVFLDDKCDGTVSSRTVLQEQATDDTYIALAGSGCDGVCKETAFVAASIRLPYVSYECSGRDLADVTQYPDFVRFGTVTVPYAFDVIRQLAANFSWKQVTIISGDPSKYREECELYQTLLSERGIANNYISAFDREWSAITGMMASEWQITKDNYRVYFFVGTEMMFRRVLCASILSGARRGITWLSQGTWREGWWRKTDMLSEFMDEYMIYDYESERLKDDFVKFKDAWDEYDTNSSKSTEEALREIYVTEAKEMFNGPPDGNQSYHAVHLTEHDYFRGTMRDHDLDDTFMIDLEGNVIYSVMKELDFATNILTGPWKDSGLADAFRATEKDPHHVAHIDWKPYGPLGGASAAFLAIGIMNKSNNDQMLGVYATMLPQTYQKPVEDIAPECSFDELAASYEGGINIVGLGRPQDANMEKPLDCFEGYSSRSFRTTLAKHLEHGFPEGDSHTMVKDPYNDLKAHAVDAVCAIAFTVQTLREEGHTIGEIQKPNDEMYQKIVTTLKTKTKFEGASGHVEFDGNDRPNYLAIQQMSGTKYTEVGFVNAEGLIWSMDGGASNASWTKEFPDPPEPEPYFPWFLFQIVAPILIVTCPMCLACYKVLLNKGDSAGFDGK